MAMDQYLYIITIFRGMNIHLPAILMFTRYQGFDPSPNGGFLKYGYPQIMDTMDFPLQTIHFGYPIYGPPKIYLAYRCLLVTYNLRLAKRGWFIGGFTA